MKVPDYEIEECHKCLDWYMRHTGRLPTERDYSRWIERAKEWAAEAAYFEIMHEDAGDRE